MTKKLITTLEKEHGILFTGKINESEKLTDAEFAELVNENRHSFSGVDHDGRIKFLKENGYEVTRENMLNSNLSVKQPPVED